MQCVSSASVIRSAASSRAELRSRPQAEKGGFGTAAYTGMSAVNVHYCLVSFQAVGIVRQESDTGFYALAPMR